MVTRSMNACLAPLAAMDGKHLGQCCVYPALILTTSSRLCIQGMSITTIEGIGSSKDPHPVQERLAHSHGSQCGFCTPGIAMSMYTLLQNNHKPTMAQVSVWRLIRGFGAGPGGAPTSHSGCTPIPAAQPRVDTARLRALSRAICADVQGWYCCDMVWTTRFLFLHRVLMASSTMCPRYRPILEGFRVWYTWRGARSEERG